MTSKLLSLASLAPHIAVIDAEQFSSLKELLDGLEVNLKANREQGRALRIAVVGQMKAGKSSFLNAALFGRDLLPKAETPMTAALTKIVYAPQAKAEVMFYSPDDWADIEQRANQYPSAYAEAERKLNEASKSESPFAKPLQAPRTYTAQEIDRQVPEAIRSSRELVEMARRQGLDVQQYLGKTEVLEVAGGAQDLAFALQAYVGSGGRFTAITKMSVLHVDDERLEGLEVIDTPGFNDPVVSRGQITRRFLGQCDVIFLLSAVSQFLTSSDMSVLREQLPEAGIDKKAVFLVGSQRDLALRQDRGIAVTASKLAERFAPAQRAAARTAAMLQLLDKKMTEQASLTLDAQINQAGQDSKTQHILGAVRKAAPHFISSWAWLVAEQFDALSEEDQEQLDQLCSATGFAFEPDSLRQLSNIPALREAIFAQRQCKQQLLDGKQQELIDGVRNGTRERLKQIETTLQVRSDQVRNGDLGALANTEQDMLSRLQSGKARLEAVFDEQLVKASQKFALLTTDIREQAQKHSRIQVVREKTTESYQVDTSWFGGLFGHDWETRYRDVVTVYASAQDAIEQVEVFALQATKALQKAIIDCVDLDELRRKVGVAAMSLFDTGSADFDGELMLAEVNKSLRRITIPNVNFGNKDYGSKIIKSFGSDRVSESQICGLKDAQREAVDAIVRDLENEVQGKVGAIERSLESSSQTFVGNMSQDIQESLAQLRKDIANKEQAIEQLNAARQAVAQALAS